VRLRTNVPACLVALAIAVAGDGRCEASSQPPARQEVQAAAARVAKEPDLATKVTEKTLRLKRIDPEPEKNSSSPRLEWLVALLQWLSETGRLLMWVAGALAVALLAVGLRRWIKARADAAGPRRDMLPSHVQSLDIRPESLPDQVGQAAAALWQRGDHRTALSLLYRGALSRLVHDHAVEIRAASTEGECVALAARRLDAVRGGFFTRLVRAWQLAVYGGRLPDAGQALELCREFDTYLPARPASEAVQ